MTPSSNVSGNVPTCRTWEPPARRLQLRMDMPISLTLATPACMSIRGSSLLRLTHDHTAINKLIEQGVITPDEADTHPQRHVLTAALGARREVSADFLPVPIPLESGDVLVLCTDGLWGQITDDELLSTVRGRAPAEACKELVRIAKNRGGPDNITVQILRIAGGEQKQPESKNGSR